MCAGELAVKIGDGGDHCGPGLGRTVLVGPIVAARVEAQRSGSVQSRNAAFAEIRFYESAQNRLRHGEQPPSRFRRSKRGRCWPLPWLTLGLRMRQAQEVPSLVGDVLEVDQAAAFTNDVEQVAMLAGGGVGLMCS
jgi:hypothetical protein